MDEIVTTQKLIELLTTREKKGFQLSVSMGILNSTKCIYYKKGLIFLFDISDDFSFAKKNGWSLDEFQKEYKNYRWILEEEL